jgi:dolichyl-phosphate beta-glucosyltransferase
MSKLTNEYMKAIPSPFVSLVIPAYNEESRIGNSLEVILAYLMRQPYSSEVIVVNDGSYDATHEIVRKVIQNYQATTQRQTEQAVQQQAVQAHSDQSGEYDGISEVGVVCSLPMIWVRLLEQPRNMGKGAAVRRGMLEAQGEYHVFMDADLSTPIYELEKMMRLWHCEGIGTSLPVSDAGAALPPAPDICIGSRGVDERLVKKHQPRYRELLGKGVNVVIQAAFTPGIADTQCGFKGFTRRASREIFSRARLNGFIFDVEVLYIALQLGFRIEEFAVEWYNDERSTVGFRHAFNIVRELVSIKFLHPKHTHHH